MPSLLHVLNGDSTLASFKTRSLPGEVFVWRDMLSEGPVTGRIGDRHFWDARLAFMSETMRVPETDYQQKVMREWEFITRYTEADEWVLWFEYDLFCQLNLVALLSTLYHMTTRPPVISLICVGREPGYDRLMCLGELPAARYDLLFRERVRLRVPDWQAADAIWTVYTSDLQGDLYDMAADLKALPYLDAALKAHLQRFPSVRNGLNVIENQLLTWISQGISEERDLLRLIMDWDTVYKPGDGVWLRYLMDLQPLIRRQGLGWRLSEAGEAVAAGNHASTWREAPGWYGGARRANFAWDETYQLLITC